METALKISVCMASCNGEQWIGEMISSILPQLSPEDELVISDDHSDDNSCAIVEQFDDRRIHLIRNGHRVGPALNFERALRAATGSLLFLADQDDLWLPQKVEKCRTLLEQNELVVHDANWIDAQGAPLNIRAFDHLTTRRGLWKNCWRNSYMGCCMALRKELFEVSLPWPTDLPMHDWWLGLLAEKRGTVQLCREPLISWRVHAQNSSPTSNRSTQGWIKRLRDRLVLWRLIRRER